jgi:hypothetical protein
MGWWGCGVMEGDTPLDAEGDILDLLGDVHAERTGGEKLDPYSDEADNIAYDAPEHPINKLYALLKEDGVSADVFNRLNTFLKEGKYDGDDICIYRQVLGEMIVCSGGILPDDVKAGCIAAAKDDDWAGGDSERKAAMKQYIKRLKGYTGTALPAESQGLFDKINDHIAAGKDGLVNV